MCELDQVGFDLVGGYFCQLCLVFVVVVEGSGVGIAGYVVHVEVHGEWGVRLWAAAT